MRKLHCDLETYSSVDITKSGLYKYVQSADFQILLCGYAFDDNPVQVLDIAWDRTLPPDLIAALQDPEVVKYAHNASFEWYCLNKFYYSPLEQWRCTMLHSLYCGYPARLEAVGSALGMPEDKRKYGTGKALIKTFCTPCEPTARNGHRTRTMPHHEPAKWELFKEYNGQDVTAEREVEHRLSAFPVPEQEQQLWILDQLINSFGVGVDTEFIESALHCSETITAELMDEAVQLSGLQNPNSASQLKEWLNEEVEEEILDIKKKTVKNLIGTIDEGKAKRMLQIRQELSKTSVKKYTAMQSAVCVDNRVRGLLQFYGANRTGRWAGRLVQVQNLPQNHLETLSHARECVKARKIDALKTIYGNIPDTLSQLIRTAFIPSPGHVFVVADFSAIEARIIAWLAGEQWRLDVFATHGKIYEASAAAMFGVPIEEVTKGSDLRQKGKIAELALGYQGAAGALITMGALDKGLTEAELPEIVRRWRAANKRIVDLWYTLENAALEVMRTGQPVGVKGILIAHEGDMANGLDFLTITLPSGRKLYYIKPFISKGDRDREALYYRGINQETRKWETVPTYGGKLVENVVQAIARDCLAESLMRLYGAGYRIVMHVHDEVIMDEPEATADLGRVIDLMCEPISWAPGLLLKADGFVTTFYKKE